MNDDTYQQIRDLFRFKWNAAIIEVLSESPQRFRPLARQVQARAPDHLDDSTLTRCLERLMDEGHIDASERLAGRRAIRTYRLTQSGRDLVRLYAELGATYEHVHDELDHGASTRPTGTDALAAGRGLAPPGP